MIVYKGYYAREPRYDREDKVYFGRAEGIDDVITFEAATPADAEAEFKKSVDFYLDFCRRVGKEPETPRAPGDAAPQAPARAAAPGNRPGIRGKHSTARHKQNAVAGKAAGAKKSAAKGVKRPPAKGAKGTQRTGKTAKHAGAAGKVR